MSQKLQELLQLLNDETPKHTPRYIGHMVSELSLPAIFGHFAILLHNPNNTSKEVSRVGLVIEKEAIRMLGDLVGYDPEHVMGHFTSGGTVANFEGMWRARYRLDHWLSLGAYLREHGLSQLDFIQCAQMGWVEFNSLLTEYGVNESDLKQYSWVAGNPWLMAQTFERLFNAPFRGPVVLVPGNKHFSWQKGVNLLGLGEDSFRTVALDQFGKLDVNDLKDKIDGALSEQRPVMMVVSVVGTTETGEIDPVDRVQELLDDYRTKKGIHIWHHIDGAYGAFLKTVLIDGTSENPLSQTVIQSLDAMGRANSITMDPHKLGYIPYSCGAFLVKDKENYAVSSFQAPYLDRPDLGEGRWSSTLEGSRTASGAAATWLTGKTMGFNAKGLGHIITRSIQVTKRLEAALEAQISQIKILKPVESNILCFSVAKDGELLSETNKRTNELFLALARCEEFSVSKTTLTFESYGKAIVYHCDTYAGSIDCDQLVMIRCVLMNPFLGQGELGHRLLEEFTAKIKSLITL
jgi:glutamate/tyrosine decarboxylase-like PLP-dependent enzyme